MAIREAEVLFNMDLANARTSARFCHEVASIAEAPLTDELRSELAGADDDAEFIGEMVDDATRSARDHGSGCALGRRRRGGLGPAPILRRRARSVLRGDVAMRDGPVERRDVTRTDSVGRRLMDRIRELDPDILECGPHCQHFTRHSGTDHAHNVTELLRVHA